AYFDIFRANYPLKRTLVALRAPGDEAGQGIGSAQIFSWLTGVVWEAVVQLGVTRIAGWLTWSTANVVGSIMALICVMLAIAAAMWSFDAFPQIDPQEIRYARAISIAFGIAAGFFLL